MENLDTFPGIDECIFCFGKVRPAKRSEVEARLRDSSPEFRAAVEQLRRCAIPHADHRDFAAWAGGPFDPKAFDIELANALPRSEFDT